MGGTGAGGQGGCGQSCGHTMARQGLTMNEKVKKLRSSGCSIERILVKESTDEVIRRVVHYGRLLRRLLEPS
jgi:hypothetical protein